MSDKVIAEEQKIPRTGSVRGAAIVKTFKTALGLNQAASQAFQPGPAAADCGGGTDAAGPPAADGGGGGGTDVQVIELTRMNIDALPRRCRPLSLMAYCGFCLSPNGVSKVLTFVALFTEPVRRMLRSSAMPLSLMSVRLVASVIWSRCADLERAYPAALLVLVCSVFCSSTYTHAIELTVSPRHACWR